MRYWHQPRVRRARPTCALSAGAEGEICSTCLCPCHLSRRPGGGDALVGGERAHAGAVREPHHLATALILPSPSSSAARGRRASSRDGRGARPRQIPLDLTPGRRFLLRQLSQVAVRAQGSAFLYARRDVQHLLTTAGRELGWNRDEPPQTSEVWETSESWRTGGRQEWQGTRDIAAYLAVPPPSNSRRTTTGARAAECHELLREASDASRSLGAPCRAPTSPSAPTRPSGTRRWLRSTAGVRCGSTAARLYDDTG